MKQTFLAILSESRSTCLDFISGPRSFFLACCLLPTASSFSQGTWTQKANFPGTARVGAVGFSIDTKGYVGTGYDNTAKKDFWEWDQATNNWTQKADVGGMPRFYAVGFSIGTKGYIGTGSDASGAFFQDFWEWDQATNIWTQKADVGGTASEMAVGFSIGSKGYIGTGDKNNISKKDFWEWDQATNTWTQKANFGGMARNRDVGFSIGTKGYIGTGWDVSAFYNDFWEWDQSSNTWTQKANFGGTARMEATGFSIKSYGYLGIGQISSNFLNCVSDFWRYDPVTNMWTAMANFGGGPREFAVGFSIGCKGYIGTGYLNDNGATYKNDFWEYTPDSIATITATISSNTTICSGSNSTLFASGGTNYVWSNSSTVNIITVSPSVTATYSVIVSDNCSSDTASVTVFVNQVTAFAWNNVTIIQGQITTLAASGGISYQWDSGATGSIISVSPSVTTVYCATVSDVIGCTDTACVTVTVKPIDCSNAEELYLPNAFSPNGDGENDVLKIYYEDTQCIKTFKLIIYDRWGEKVFQTKNPLAGWDGTYKGKLANTAVFVYYMKATLISGKEIINKGNISLIQ